METTLEPFLKIIHLDDARRFPAGQLAAHSTPLPVTYDVLSRTEFLESTSTAMPPRYGQHPAQPVVFVRDRHGLHRVPQSAIRSLHAEGNYVELHCGHRRFVLRTSLRELMLQLGHAFTQVNRNTAVNRQHVERVDPDSVTVDGMEHTLSRSFRSALLEGITVLG
jgi:DNA-binding LytR/AlgR family response regulator